MTCPHCGGRNFTWARRCDHCDAPLAPPVAPPAAPPARAPEPERRVDDAGGPHAAEWTTASAGYPEPAAPYVSEAQAFLAALTAATPRLIVTPALVVLNVVVFVAMLADGLPASGNDIDVLMRWGATYGPLVTTGEWWRLMTSVFVHGGFLHLFLNMLVLVNIGPITERLYGHAAFLTLYLLSGLAGSLAGVLWHPVVPSVGASGAVFGVMGMILAYALRERQALHRSVLQSFARSIGWLVAVNMVLGLALPMVNVAAHAGGLVAGFAFGLLLTRPLVRLPFRTQFVRSAAVAMIGAALAAASLRALPSYDDWIAAEDQFTRTRTLVQRDLQQLLEGLQDGSLSPGGFDERLDSKVLQPWRSTRDRIASLRLPGEQQEQSQQIVRIMDLLEESWRLMGKAVLTDDLRLVKESQQKRAEAEAIDQALLAKTTGRQPTPPAGPDIELEQAIALQNARRTFVEFEKKAVDTYKKAAAQVERGTMSERALADLVDNEIVPTYQVLFDALQKMQAPSHLALARNRLTEGVRLRMESWVLLARGLRTKDRQLVQDAVSRQRAAEKMLTNPDRPAPSGGARRGRPSPTAPE